MSPFKQFIILTGVSLFCSFAFGSNFTLQRSGESVCKVTQETKSCYQISPDLEMNFEIVAMAKNQLAFLQSGAESMTLDQMMASGGTVMLEPEQLAHVVENYRLIDIRNFAIDLANITETADGKIIPFVADVRWKGSAAMEGTLHTTGEILIPALEEGEDTTKENMAQFNIQDYSDSGTEQKKSFLQFLESSARAIHFKAVYGMDADSEEKTKEFLNTIVAPTMAGQLYLPAWKALAEALPQLMGEALGKAMGEVIVGIGEAISEALEQGLQPENEQ